MHCRFLHLPLRAWSESLRKKDPQRLPVKGSRSTRRPPIRMLTARRRGFKLQPRREWLSPTGTGYEGGACPTCPQGFRSKHAGSAADSYFHWLRLTSRHQLFWAGAGQACTCAAVPGVSRLVRTLLQPRGLATNSAQRL